MRYSGGMLAERLSGCVRPAGCLLGAVLTLAACSSQSGLQREEAVSLRPAGGSAEGMARFPLTAAPLVWVDGGKLIASKPSEFHYFGDTVALSGERALIGADGNARSAYAFARSAGSWGEEQRLSTHDGAKIRALSIEGERALVGTHLDSEVASYAGAAYVFARSAGTWLEEQKLMASDGGLDHYFGSKVSLDGERALVGSVNGGGRLRLPAHGEHLA